MATTLKQIESEPASYPALPMSPAILSDAAAAIDPAVVWERIESHIAHRYAEREVVWLVEGPGQWDAPLTPATITGVEVWTGSAWEACEPAPAPVGYWLANNGPYRVAAMVGPAEVPPPILEAYRRLAEFFAAKPGKPGATAERVTAGSVSVSTTRSATWLANALAASGAADLLRPYRRI